MRAEDNGAASIDEPLHNFCATRERIQFRILIRAFPRRSVENCASFIGTFPLRLSDMYLLYLRAPDDLELLTRNPNTMAFISINTGLASGKDDVVDGVNRIETGRFL